MFFQFLEWLFPDLARQAPLQVFSYTSVRGVLAMSSAFVIGLLLGPLCIRRLQALKLGQQVREFKTQDTQAFNIHQHKAGTPTMGGLLIIVATLVPVFLFCNPTNSYVLVVAGIMVLAGALGFADDYLKIARRNHKGVSARAKLAVQVLLGAGLGLFLHFSPSHTSYGSSLLSMDDVADPGALIVRLRDGDDPFARFVTSQFSAAAREAVEDYHGNGSPPESMVRSVVREINQVIAGRPLHLEAARLGLTLSPDAGTVAAQVETRPRAGSAATRLNRLILEEAWPGLIRHTPIVRGDTHLLVPFFKDLYPLLGVLFIPWVAFVLAGTSNAVNLTDGLDGLAIGTVITVCFPYAAIAYLASRFDYAAYLYLPHVPQAGELAVFLTALIGASMAFLWFNAHPAQVFMGDTGSLSLGAVIGAIAVMCKHEILLVLIGGIFVVEALSVMLQVGYFRWSGGKRLLLMSPLHNHFVKKQMDEAKIIARFLLVATLLALAGLLTLKLR